MNKPIPVDDDDSLIIDVTPQPPKRRHWRRWVLLSLLALVFALVRGFSMYISALWFGSLGYASVYWTIFRYKLVIFLVFAVVTVLILREAFLLLERVFAASALERRTIVVNNQPVSFSPARFVRPVAWVVSLLFGLIFGLEMKESWRSFALYLNQPATEGAADPIFQKTVGFYLFTLPVHQTISWWLTVLAFVILAATIVMLILSSTQKLKQATATAALRRTGYAAVSIALALYLLMLAWRTYLSRFPYLWQDHASFAGVTYTEANYLLPGLLIVVVALIIAAAIALLNAFTKRGLRLLLAAIALPVAVFLVAVALVPAYVTSFIVKPNELGRETPYIEHNITWTRRAFGLDRIELRDFEADPSVEGLNLDANKATLDNIRLWDWHALQDTLRQIQEIRTYYDFPDVDIDRYHTSGQTPQMMMLAARELDVDKLPESSRNWVNEKLIYTHGYGVTMNTSNGFTAEGMPQFVLSNMPMESSTPEIKVTRPEIYYGQKTNTDIYVKTKQKEFNYPQGEASNFTAYEEDGGIRVGGFFRRTLLAWSLGDLSKLPFSDDVTADSRLLMRRNIRDRVQALAPFLYFDNDPYIVVSDTGRLYWIMDAFTESTNYPYSRHYRAEEQSVNYIRNSVKVTIDAYNGSTIFYIFDAQDPLIKAYATTFPALFRDAAQMPADLRAHVRYPETLLKTQGEVYGLYHTQSAKVFFQREDVWSVARQAQASSQDKQQQPEALEPYYVITQLPGEQTGEEFVQILPFTPASRPNMIGWMAGRSDGAAYGSLLVYNFPKSRLINGPAQIEARIDQNAQLSGQFTLWNQQGSRVVRGNLLVIPIGRSLFYVEPVYLRSERSPMPELRIVVVATQDRLGYGQSFQEALTNLIGQPAKPSEQKPEEPQQQKPSEEAGPPAPVPTPATPLPQNTQQLINRAAEEFAAYQRLTAEGKLSEAGQKLESLKKTLEELKKVGGKQ